MGTLRVIAPDGTTSDLEYPEREAPIEMLQDIAGGYVEHVPVTYDGARRSAYVVDPFGRLLITDTRSRASILEPNLQATAIVGQPIRGAMAIDLGTKHEAGPKPGGARIHRET